MTRLISVLSFLVTGSLSVNDDSPLFVTELQRSTDGHKFTCQANTYYKEFAGNLSDWSDLFDVWSPSFVDNLTATRDHFYYNRFQLVDGTLNYEKGDFWQEGYDPERVWPERFFLRTLQNTLDYFQYLVNTYNAARFLPNVDFLVLGSEYYYHWPTNFKQDFPLFRFENSHPDQSLHHSWLLPSREYNQFGNVWGWDDVWDLIVTGDEPRWKCCIPPPDIRLADTNTDTQTEQNQDNSDNWNNADNANDWNNGDNSNNAANWDNTDSSNNWDNSDASNTPEAVQEAHAAEAAEEWEKNEYGGEEGADNAPEEKVEEWVQMEQNEEYVQDIEHVEEVQEAQEVQEVQEAQEAQAWQEAQEWKETQQDVQNWGENSNIDNSNNWDQSQQADQTEYSENAENGGDWSERRRRSLLEAGGQELTEAGLQPWREKITKALFRGAVYIVEQMRFEVLEMLVRHRDESQKLFDVRMDIASDEVREHEMIKQNKDWLIMESDQKMKDAEEMKYKFIIVIDGSCSADRVVKQLLYGAVMFRQESKYKNVYYYDMVPYVHYIPWFGPEDLFRKVKFYTEGIDPELSGYEYSERMIRFLSNIASNGRKFALDTFNSEFFDCHTINMLHLYANTFKKMQIDRVTLRDKVQFNKDHHEQWLQQNMNKTIVLDADTQLYRHWVKWPVDRPQQQLLDQVNSFINYDAMKWDEVKELRFDEVQKQRALQAQEAKEAQEVQEASGFEAVSEDENDSEATASDGADWVENVSVPEDHTDDNEDDEKRKFDISMRFEGREKRKRQKVIKSESGKDSALKESEDVMGLFVNGFLIGVGLLMIGLMVFNAVLYWRKKHFARKKEQRELIESGEISMFLPSVHDEISLDDHLA